MSFGDQVAFLKRLRLMLLNEGPRDSAGELIQPFRGWVLRLEKDIALADRVVPTEKGGDGDGRGL